MDAHSVVSLQIQHLRCTCARRMLASDQKWQKGIGVALTSINDVPEIRETFSQFFLAEVATTYSIGRQERGEARAELLVSNFHLPRLG